MLIEIAQRLQNILGPKNKLSRFGGDEYLAVVLDNGLDIRTLAARIQAVVSQPIQAAAHQVTVSISVGWARSSGQATTYAALYQAADRTMYRKKQATQ